MKTRSILAIGGVCMVAFVLGSWATSRWGQVFLNEEVVVQGELPQEGRSKIDTSKRILYWKSKMVPGEIHDKPGQDSMGMDLEPVYEGDSVGAGEITISPATVQNMGVRVAPVLEGALVKTVRTVGYVDYDETTLGVVTTKINGWVEKLYVDETGAQVHAGDPLFELYSPSLFSAQEEYLVAIKSVQKKDVPIVPQSKAHSEALIRDARVRLEFFDIPTDVIDEIARLGVPKKTLTLRSPFTGIITHKSIVEGQRVMAGEALLKIADLSRVWVQGRVYEYDLPYVRLGQEARMTLSYLPGKTFVGKVAYIYPYLETGTREVSLRMEFFNPGYELKPGMYATIHLRSELKDKVTLVDDVAVLDTGERSVAFVAKGRGRFELRDVRTGLRSENNKIEVLSGLNPGELVVLSGQFLLDSESRLREAALKFLEPAKKTTAEEPNTKPATMPAEVELPAPKVPEEYVCPMPEHASIRYDRPGDCPICGKAMTLVPRVPTAVKVDEKKNSRGR